MLLISEETAIALVDAATAQKVVLDAMHAHAHGRVGLSEPRSMYLRDGNNGGYYHVKGAFLADPGIAGFRLNGFPPSRASSKQFQAILLTDLVSTMPLALVGTDALSTLRVGAAIALAVEWLKASTAETLALIGTGRLARAAVTAIQMASPDLLPTICLDVEKRRGC